MPACAADHAAGPSVPRSIWLSAKVLRFSGSYLAPARLPHAIQPALNRLAVQTQELLSAVVLDADEVAIVACSGNDRHSSATATGRVMASGLHMASHRRLSTRATKKVGTCCPSLLRRRWNCGRCYRCAHPRPSQSTSWIG